MVFDIAILVILLICMIFGFRNGLFGSILRIGGWLIAVAVAFFTHKFVENFLMGKTSIFDKLHDHIVQICLSFIEKYTGGISGSVPGKFGEAIEDLGSSLAGDAADKIAEFAFTVLVFMGILLFVKIILFVLTFLLSRKRRDGIIGGVDGILGLIFGLLQGVIIVLVLFALLMPLSYVINAEAYGIITASMENSYVAEIIYNNNPLLSIIDGIVPPEIDPKSLLDKSDYEFVIPDFKDMI
ncbi:MAG: CvpA family protein [Clostridiales Family XIII bacterium]|jgi:uncharacterized membrane protein required for colicin V production|nr:CvpA family protein [Clostridiales Family XIII bacterium]